jgi:hypothetical protein
MAICFVRLVNILATIYYVGWEVIEI